MSKASEDWSSIIERYKSSGLSQREFCTQHNVSWNQFHYRWSRYKSASKPKSDFIASGGKATSLFEQVTIATPAAPKQAVVTHGLVIHFPNQLRCDVAVDLESQAFPLLLKTLVALC